MPKKSFVVVVVIDVPIWSLENCHRGHSGTHTLLVTIRNHVFSFAYKIDQQKTNDVGKNYFEDNHGGDHFSSCILELPSLGTAFITEERG